MLFRNITMLDESFAAQTGMYIQTEGNRITYIGKEAPAGYSGKLIDGRGKLAASGFFNMHCHVPMTLLRGYGEGLPLHRWLNEKMFPFEDLLSVEDVYWGSLLGIAEMLRSGAVSFTDMYMQLPGICRAVEESGIKANLSHGTNGFSVDARFADVGGWQGTQAILEYVRGAGHNRVIAEASIHAEYTSQERLLRDVAEFAAENRMQMHVHVSETRSEHEECKARREGRTPAAWFAHCGLFDVPATAAHCVWIEDSDIPILAEYGVTVVHCPSSNLKLGSGIAPVRKMIEGGVRVCVGTDGAASNNNLNMLEELNLASLLQKGASRDPLFMGPQQTLELACKNGAAAQGRTDCGCLKVGNRADIVLYDLQKPYMQPVFDVSSNLLYAAQADAVCLSMVDGKVLYKDGEFLTIDMEKVLFQAKRIRDEKLAQLEN